MKKYYQPQSAVVNMNLESSILSASNIHREEATDKPLTGKKNMWGKENMWE